MSGEAILVKASSSRIKNCLKGQRSGFCYFKGLNGEPRKDVEGMKILYSDGDEVKGESVIVQAREGELKFSPLSPVVRPHPCSPPEKGFKYVDLEQDLYSIEFMGVEHFFHTLDELILKVLEKRPGTRDDLQLLAHTLWTEVQDLELSKYGEYRERIPRSKVEKVAKKYQVRELRFPPCTPEEVKKRYRNYGKSYRHFDSVQDYAFQVRDYYSGDVEFRPGDYFEKEKTDEGEEDSSSTEKRLKQVKEAVSG